MPPLAPDLARAVKFKTPRLYARLTCLSRTSLRCTRHTRVVTVSSRASRRDVWHMLDLCTRNSFMADTFNLLTHNPLALSLLKIIGQATRQGAYKLVSRASRRGAPTSSPYRRP